MRLKDIMDGVIYENLNGKIDIEIKNLKYDSRAVEKGDLFFCIEGFNMDGHKYVKSAIEKGATAIICSKDLQNEINSEHVTFLKVSDTRNAMALCAGNFFNHSDRKLKLIGITGTNGKTTSSFMIKKVLETAGYKVGIIGTIANYICNKRIDTKRTTPESIELHQLFSEMVEAEVDYCIMEVSSHSLVLSRVYGLEFEIGIFSNLTQDHLDFHKTFENYYNAKLMLFKNSKVSIVNIEDKYGKNILGDISNKKVTYGLNSKCNIYAEEVNMHSRGIDFLLCYEEKKCQVNLSMPGNFNLFNALSSAAACLKEGIDIDIVAKGLNSITGVPGRCELISKDYNIDFDIIIDYAHTPDALEKILNTINGFTKGRLISVFGCGGDRDRTKRPEMGFIGSENSDFVVITSDNPRSEEPVQIINEIVMGIKKDNFIIVEDRKSAIKKAIMLANKDDTILIAGKGHENYQELKEGKIDFNEKEIVDEILKDINC